VVAGVIEHNPIVASLVYDFQIQHQQPRPRIPSHDDPRRIDIFHSTVLAGSGMRVTGALRRDFDGRPHGATPSGVHSGSRQPAWRLPMAPEGKSGMPAGATDDRL
jgi:hypothetical protein